MRKYLYYHLTSFNKYVKCNEEKLNIYVFQFSAGALKWKILSDIFGP